MMYVGTEDAKILTYSLADLYSDPVSKSGILQKMEKDDISEEELSKMLKKNQ